MSANPIQDDLLDRLVAAGKDEEPFAILLAYACDGEEALRAALTRPADEHPRVAPRRGEATARADAPRAYLRSIKVRAFRGIGPERSLLVPEGRGLTVVTGRNGCGKSSFAEAAELLFTDQCSRFTAAVAAEGWRNHHVQDPPMIAAEVVVEGKGSVTFSRRWGRDAGLRDGQTVVKDDAGTVPLGDTPWLRASRDFRPFLAYSQLGEMLDGKSALYDALMTGLGLEHYVEVRTRLMNAARELDKRQNDAKDAATGIAAAAAQARSLADDARLVELMRLLEPTRGAWKLEELERLVSDDLEDDGRGQVLRQLATLRVPDASLAAEAMRDLREAAERVRQMGERSAGRARQLADLLERALAVTAAADDARCPVCGTDDVIQGSWRAGTEAAVARHRAEATEADDAQRALDRARAAVMQLCTAPPGALAVATRVGIDVRAAAETWRQFASAPSDPAAIESLVAHVEQLLPRLLGEVEAVVTMARAELARREDAWRPVALQLAAWIPEARVADAGRDTKKHLRKAEDWLKDVIEDIRRDRFAPIAQQATHYWSKLRLQSSVELRDVQMVGSGPRRSVQLDVAVDGTETSALSVMSQGELNSLALSLFLPRATMADSPFGFVLIDDPVQALDPAKVEGLARVLAEAAATHQVIVFTHDDRLPEAVRRLEIPATFVDITRKDRSVVEIRRVKGPVAILLEDAAAIARTEHMPDSIKLRLVPNFCRSALEAACQEVVRARRLGRGELHADVEDLLVRSGRLRHLMALALFDDVERMGEVEQRLAQDTRSSHKQTFRNCLTGAHGEFTGDPLALVGATQALADFVKSRGSRL